MPNTVANNNAEQAISNAWQWVQNLTNLFGPQWCNNFSALTTSIWEIT